MKCEACGIGEREDRLVRYTLSIGDRLAVVEHVPAEVCGHCGETSLNPDVVERLQQTIWSRSPDRVVETSVYEFA